MRSRRSWSIAADTLAPVALQDPRWVSLAVRAVAALAADAAADRGWTPARLDRLRRLRADESPLVAGAAALLWPPREQDPGF